MNGKGSKRRPSQISEAELERRWNAAFPKRCPNKEQTVQYQHKASVTRQINGVDDGSQKRGQAD